MSYRRVIDLWESNNEETHGGENNGGARRVFSPKSTKYSDQEGLSSWANRLAFGFFHSGHGSDPARGGNIAGQANSVDYITGMPDLRTEHLHAIDCAGYDKLRIVWAAECIDYEGLRIDWANVPDDTLSAWADAVYAVAYGVDVVKEGLDFVNFPPALWANANDTLAGEGVGSNLAGLQVLTNNPLTSGTSWSVANGFTLSANTAVYAHSASGGTLTQTSGNFSSGVIASKQYILTYQITASTVAGGDLTLSGVSASTITGLPRAIGTHQVTFPSHATPGNFVLTATSSSGGFTMDNIYLTQDAHPGADRRPRPMFAAASNGAFNESELFRATGALTIRGTNFGAGGSGISDLSRYSIAKIPNGLPVAAAPSQQVAWGALQWGLTQKFGALPYGHIPRAGDRYRVVLDIGLPSGTTSGTSAPPVTQDAYAGDLWITGLERVYFAMCSVGVDFATGANPGISPTYLVSSPIGPATAPRQHIKGRMYAILSSLSGRTGGDI